MGNITDLFLRQINLEEKNDKRLYEKPSYELETIMTFPFNNVNQRNAKYTCRQCSSCHGCR